jgi:hypothetical protein
MIAPPAALDSNDSQNEVNVMKPSVPLSVALLAFLAMPFTVRAQDKYVVPASPRIKYNFNADWQFIRQDVPGAQVVGFDDSKWQTVSTPHSFNDVDSFRTIINHSGGDRGTYKGLSWYRKHFKLPAEAAGIESVHRVRGHAPGRRHLFQRQALWFV